MFVPLTPSVTVAHLARRFALPLIIVTRPGLGTLNHTLMTLHCARMFRLRVAGLVINHLHAPQDARERLIRRTNAAALRRMVAVPFLGEFPYQPRLGEGLWNSATLSRVVTRHLDTRRLR